MTRSRLHLRWLAVATILLAGAPAGAAAAGPSSSGAAGMPQGPATVASTPPAGSGGAGVGGLAPTRKPPRVPASPSRLAHGHWLGHVTITEYWAAPESWFAGRLVSAPGLSGKHRIDWLYSATGVSMEGDGIGLDGRTYHIDAPGRGGWVTASGQATRPSDDWLAGAPYWRAGGFWRNAAGGVTFPLGSGGWAAGRGRRYVPLSDVSFAAGAALPLRFLQSIAVDPRVIPLGSRVYVPAYRGDGHGGWFVAQDTGGAIFGHHIDVYRRPPASPARSGQYLTGARVYVIKPAG